MSYSSQLAQTLQVLLKLQFVKVTCNFGLGYRLDCCYYYIIFQYGPIRASVTMILLKGRLFSDRLKRGEDQGLGTTREDRGMQEAKFYLNNDWTFFQNCFRVSLVYLIASTLLLQHESTSSKSPSPPVFCATFLSATWYEPRAIFTKNQLHSKGVTDIHTALAGNPWPTIRDPMPL